MTEKTKVLYDGACPLCRREIGFYRERRGADGIDWIDVSACGPGNVTATVSREDALRRFHVITPSGEIVQGGGAFAALWSALPGFRIVGRMARVPPLAWVLDRTYDLFLVLRPWLQRRMSGAAKG